MKTRASKSKNNSLEDKTAKLLLNYDKLNSLAFNGS